LASRSQLPPNVYAGCSGLRLRKSSLTRFTTGRRALDNIGVLIRNVKGSPEEIVELKREWTGFVNQVVVEDWGDAASQTGETIADSSIRMDSRKR
jgi:hypothetical protein